MLSSSRPGEAGAARAKAMKQSVREISAPVKSRPLMFLAVVLLLGGLALWHERFGNHRPKHVDYEALIKAAEDGVEASTIEAKFLHGTTEAQRFRVLKRAVGAGSSKATALVVDSCASAMGLEVATLLKAHGHFCFERLSSAAVAAGGAEAGHELPGQGASCLPPCAEVLELLLDSCGHRPGVEARATASACRSAGAASSTNADSSSSQAKLLGKLEWNEYRTADEFDPQSDMNAKESRRRAAQWRELSEQRRADRASALGEF